MRILVDTNVLLRAIQPDSQFCTPARSALKRLLRQGVTLCLAPQNVREFWNACTRPTDRNGLGISVSGTDRHTRYLEKYFVILPDSAQTYTIWRRLVAEHQVMGVKVHGVNRILTFNTGDFARYTDIRAVDPVSLTQS